METTKKLNSVCFFMAGTLFDFNLKVAEQLRTQNPNVKLSAFVCGRRHLLSRFNELDNTPNAFDRYDWLNDMISKWLQTPIDHEKLDRYREMFGDDLLRRLVTADRELGYGYVSGGIVEKTNLIDKCLKNKDARWQYIIGLLDYCFDLLDTQKPDIVYIYAIAGADAMGLKIVADYLKIPAIQLSFTRINDYYMFDQSIEMTMPQIKKAYQEALQDPSCVSSYYQEASKFIDDFLSKPEPPQDTLTWVKKIKKDNHPFFFIKTLAIDIMKAIAIKMGLQGSKGIYRQRYGFDIVKLTLFKFLSLHKVLRGQHSKSSDIIGSYNYIAYFLHYDPEMTTSIMADKNADQLAVIEQISKQMPAGWKLIVKEHIPMIGRRPKSFYKRLRQTPDVVCVSPFESSFHILKNCDALVTLTGTVGWEAVLFGKVPIVMGYPYYTNLYDGIIHCPKVSGLSKAIDKAVSAKPVSKEHIKLFVASMIKNAFIFPTTYFWYNESLPEKEVDKLAKMFVKYLNKEVLDD